MSPSDFQAARVGTANSSFPVSHAKEEEEEEEVALRGGKNTLNSAHKPHRNEVSGLECFLHPLAPIRVSTSNNQRFEFPQFAALWRPAV